MARRYFKKCNLPMFGVMDAFALNLFVYVFFIKFISSLLVLIS